MKTLKTCLATTLAVVALVSSTAAFAADEVLFEKEWSYGCMWTPLCGDARERVDLRGHQWIRVEYDVFADDRSGGSLYVDLAYRTEVFSSSKSADLKPERAFIELRQSYVAGNWFFGKHNKVRIIGL